MVDTFSDRMNLKFVCHALTAGCIRHRFMLDFKVFLYKKYRMCTHDRKYPDKTSTQSTTVSMIGDTAILKVKESLSVVKDS